MCVPRKLLWRLNIQFVACVLVNWIRLDEVYQGTRPSFALRAPAAKNLSENAWAWLITSPLFISLFCAGHFFTGWSHLSLSKWEPFTLRGRPVLSVIIKGNSLYRTITAVHWRDDPLPCPAQTHEQSEQTTLFNFHPLSSACFSLSPSSAGSASLSCLSLSSSVSLCPYF